MKLLRLSVNGYKNLGANAVFNFENCSNYVALIGLNGSGKSNILEAISKIIHSYYYKQPIPNIATDGGFEFLLEYEKGGNKIRLQNNQIFVNNRPRKRNLHQYLPSQIIACYSGEELRLWEDIFSRPYLKYFNKVKLNYLHQKLRFLYINKYSWETALLTLMCHSESENFIKQLLGINDLQDVNVTFQFSNAYEYRKTKYSIANTTEFVIPQFTDRIKTEQEFYPAIIVESENEQILPDIERLAKEPENQFLKLSEIKGIGLGNLQSDNNNIEWCRKLFDFLFLATMPKNKKIITRIKIEFNNKDVRKLSEGEKKLLLIKCISSVLADDNSIVLYDEPDVSLHISRKKEIKNLIENKNHFTVLTTHSPKLIKELEEKNVFIVNNNNASVEVIDTDTIRNIEHITHNEFSLVDATLMYSLNKDILLVEGTNDYNYIQEAISKLSPQFDNFNFHIINCGGADNVPTVLEQSIINLLKPNQKCICLFDYDGQGRRNFQKIEDIVINSGNNNIIPMYHPKDDGTPHTGTNEQDNFLMEYYFPVTSYKNIIINEFQNKNTFRQLSEYQQPKSIIQNKYKSFNSIYYSNFAVLLQRLISEQTP